MEPINTPRDSQTDLAQALRLGVLSDPLAQQGQDILDRLQLPPRLSILGLPGTGKSTLMNLLLGAPIVPMRVGLPTLSITYGEDDIATCTLADGTTRAFNAHSLANTAALDPIFIEATLALPALEKLSLMEVVAGATGPEQERALNWAAKRTDIALWCTQGFTDQEIDLWDLMPEHVQDRSFLLLSKADMLGPPTALNQALEDARDAADEQFRHMMAIHAQGAIAATKSDGAVDKEALRRSGGIALISAILREVETGKQIAAEKADIFLRQIDYDPETTAAQVVQATGFATVPAPEIIPQAAHIPLDPLVISEAAREACTQGAAQLEAEGAVLIEEMHAGRLTPDAVMDVSVDTISWLAEYLSDSGAANDPVLEKARSTANDAADLVQLIQLETSETVAADAVRLMIQLKHELLAKLGA